MERNLYVSKIREWRSEGLNWERISEKLIAEGIPQDAGAEALAVVKKEHRARNRNRGMILIGIGSIFCFFSMLFTFLYGHNYFMLYGLTMLGVTIAFAGLVYVMG